MSVLNAVNAVKDEPLQPPDGQTLRMWRRFGFRLLFVYVLLYLLSLFATTLWEPLVAWVGQHIFRTDVVQELTGSGDTVFDYLMALCCAALVLPAMLVWTALDKYRASKTRLDEWIRVAGRFTLAFYLLQYGIIKIIPTQFSSPGLSTLTEPLGDHSPMGLLWAFMGASPAYTIFAGAVEALGGLLLLSRRTTLLGSMASIVALGNVFALNLCYDVPVKLLSVHLLAMAALLAAPDIGRLTDLFLWNRSAPSADLRPHSARHWINWILLGVKTILFGGLVASFVFGALSSRDMSASLGPKPPLYGVWNADEPVQDGLPDTARWRQAVFEFPGVVSIQTADGLCRYFRISVNPMRGTLRLTTPRDKTWASHLVYTQTAPGRITFQGEFDGHPLRATLARVPETKPPLFRRGFHWISPFPFNR